MSTLATISRILFATDGIINSALYLPQIVKTWKVPQGSSLTTWGLWALTSLDGVVYAVVVAKNLELTLVLAGNLVGCFAVFLVAFLGQRRLKD